MTIANKSECAWQVVTVQEEQPTCMHLRNAQYEADIIAIRGTLSYQDIMQNFVLFNQITMLRELGHSSMYQPLLRSNDGESLPTPLMPQSQSQEQSARRSPSPPRSKSANRR